MRKFIYKVKNSKNEIIDGSIHANSVAEAAIKLERRGNVVLEIHEELQKSYIREKTVNYNSAKIVLSVQEKKEFFNSFYFLYKSGLSILEIFKSMSISSKNPKIITLCSRILRGIEKGQSLKDSMKTSYSALGQAYSMLIVAGEESGQLDDILTNIIKNIKTQEETKSSIISKLTYPVCMFFFALFVAMLFKFFIIQIFLLKASGESVCMSALIISAIIKIIVVFGVLIGSLIFIYKNKYVLNKIISFFTTFGIFSKLMKKYYFMNFFSVLALSYEAGISPSECLYLANSVINVPYINSRIKKAETMVQNGCEMTTALGCVGLFSSYAMSQVATGEKAGKLDKMLRTVASDYENRLLSSVSVILKVIEPLMIIFVGIIVLFVAISGYKAYFNFLFSFV